MGSGSGATNRTVIGWNGANTKEIGSIAASSTVFSPTTANTAKEGLICITNNDSARTMNYYHNGALTGTSDTSSSSNNLFNSPIGVGSRCTDPTPIDNTDYAVPTARYIRFACGGLGLTATDAANMHTRVLAFQTALSRNV